VSTSTTVAGARFANDTAVLGKRIGVGLVAERMQELRRALDVGEEERNGAAREVSAHAESIARRNLLSKCPAEFLGAVLAPDAPVVELAEGDHREEDEADDEHREDDIPSLFGGVREERGESAHRVRL
jgi:hypothetical protein